MQLDHISVSTIETWRQCRRKLWMAKQPGAKRESGEAAVYGKALHKYAEDKAVSLGAVKVIYPDRKDDDAALPAGGAPYPPGYAANWSEDTMFINSVLKRMMFDNVEVEARLGLEVDDTALLGYIDWIRVSGDDDSGTADSPVAVYILDWKTTKLSKWRKGAAHSFQLKVYAAWARAKFGIDATRITCALAFTRGQELSEAVFTGAQLDQALVEIAEAGELIAAFELSGGGAADCTPSALCQYCDAFEGCPVHVESEF
jgi:hypothetical protein